MIGILIVTHGDFGKELIRSAELIVGKQENTLALGLFHGDNIDVFREKIAEYIKKLDNEEGLLIFTDLYGGSPSNAIAINAKRITDVRFKCITGVNLPMVLEALTMRKTLELNQLKEYCMEMAHQGIKDLNKAIELK
jgi:PTS system mannose-specific IIA component